MSPRDTDFEMVVKPVMDPCTSKGTKSYCITQVSKACWYKVSREFLQPDTKTDWEQGWLALLCAPGTYFIPFCLEMTLQESAVHNRVHKYIVPM